MRAMSKQGLQRSREAMEASGVHPRAIDVFTHYYRELERGETGLIAESDIEPLTSVPRAADLDVPSEDARQALAATAVIKLNGGLGTSMGLDKAKSLVTVLDDLTFLDIIVGQIMHLREQYDVRL